MDDTIQLPEQLTNSYHIKQHLVSTPDGTHLVFAETRGAYITLKAIRCDGSEERVLFPDRKDYIQQHPAWSRDGKRLAFTVSDGYRNGRIGIMVCDSNGMEFTNFRPLAMGGQDSNPTFSRDGGQVAFISGSLRLTVADADGKARRIIGPVDGIQAQPNWSPDGEWIAFTSSHEDGYAIYTIHPDGSGLTRRTHGPTLDYRPVYAPDGRWLAFSSNRGGNWDLYLMRPDGSEVRRLTSDPAKDDHAAWTADSRRIAFVSTRHGGYDIYRLTLFDEPAP
jgi:TolB protein